MGNPSNVINLLCLQVRGNPRNRQNNIMPDIPAGDINEMGDEDSLEQEYTKCFICDRWEEVVAYLGNVRYMFNTFSTHIDPRKYNVERQYN